MRGFTTFLSAVGLRAVGDFNDPSDDPHLSGLVVISDDVPFLRTRVSCLTKVDHEMPPVLSCDDNGLLR